MYHEIYKKIRVKWLEKDHAASLQKSMISISLGIIQKEIDSIPDDSVRPHNITWWNDHLNSIE
jgi:hypothetical protein